jgi:hypothetical protein
MPRPAPHDAPDAVVGSPDRDAHPTGAETPPVGGPWSVRRADALAAGLFVLIAFGLYRDLWLHLGSGYLVDSDQDQNLFEWFFAVQAQAVAAGHPTLFSTLQNFPAGVNLMANTAMPGLAVPLAPLTLLAGPTVTWALLLTGGLAATATGWYRLFSRYLVGSRAAAAVGGAVTGFGPPMISHAHAHPNFAAGFLLPAIVAALARLAGIGAGPVAGPGTAARWGEASGWRSGLWLGALTGWQVLIGEEPLFILAVGLAVWVLVWALARPRAVLAAARRALPGLVVALALTVVMVGYPLWVQFAGPGSYRGLSHAVPPNDLAGFAALPRQSIGGQLLHPGAHVANPTEQNSFFGWPLLVLLLVASTWLWRRPAARLATVTVVVLAALSAGSPFSLDGRVTSVPGPWAALDHLPLFDSLIESRLALACLPAMGVLLALGTDRALARPGVVRGLWCVALAVALAPIVPVRYAVTPRPDTPAVFASGDWREYVRPEHSVLTVPPPDPRHAAALHWQVRAGLGFPLVEGYFVGPFGPAGRGTYGAVRPYTSLLLGSVAAFGQVPPIGQAERAQAATDLRGWHTDLVVLPDPAGQPALVAMVSALLGPGQARDGALLWDVRGLDPGRG